MLDLIILALIGLAFVAVYHKVFKVFIKTCFLKIAIRNYAKRRKLWRAIIFKRKFFFKIAIAKLKEQKRRQRLNATTNKNPFIKYDKRIFKKNWLRQY